MSTSPYSHCSRRHPVLMHHRQVGTTISAQPHKQMHFVQHLFPVSTGLYIWNTHLQHTAPQHLDTSTLKVFILSLSDRNFNTSFYKLKTTMQTKGCLKPLLSVSCSREPNVSILKPKKSYYWFPTSEGSLLHHRHSWAEAGDIYTRI